MLQLVPLNLICWMVIYRVDRASDISRKKKQNFAGISGQIRRKIGRFRGIFAEKSQYSRKNLPILQNFRGRNVKFRRKTGRFRGILAEKVKFRRIFQGQILRKIGRFHGKFRGGNFAKKQSVKNCRFRWIFFGKFR